jgi:hypothetical protein
MLALDAPLVAILWQRLLAKGLHVRVQTAETLVLGMTCWMIYAIDYLRDGWRASETERLTERHAFFRLHRKRMLIAVGVIFACTAGVAFTCLDRATILYGLLCGLLVAGYLSLTHLRPPHLRVCWPRELCVAFLFSAGTCISIWAASDRMHRTLLVSAIIFGFLCWINVAAIEYWEWVRLGENVARKPSRSALWLARYVRPSLTVAAIVVAGLAVREMIPERFSVAALLSTAAFLLLDLRSGELSGSALRSAADFALFSPAVVFVLDRLR